MAKRNRVFTDLNLNGGSPARVQPTIGEWGPAKVPTTKQKKRLRIWAIVAFVLALTAVFGYGYYIWKAMTGN